MKKRIALFLLTGACLMNTVPCFASQSVKVSYVGSQGTEYSTLPDSGTLQRDAGFKPKAPAALAGGYQFDSGRITESFDMDADGAQVNRQKGINFQYVKQSGSTAKTVTLSAEPASGQSFSKDSTLVEYGEMNLYYTTDQANSISWMDGDVYYMLMDIKKSVSKDELTAMAKQMIDMDTTSAQ
ncbi:DUF4367 domain-containing protein [Enterocloster sp. OA13]|uniref:hypothetical protein n=1 Tax=Enterocloster sp. OA13 TaxID=2914161 RepID=UPI0004725D85|nr:DUF4367 domain-containing protein [Enterocloster sp. OA13]